MTVELRSLRVSAEMDASKFVSGAKAIETSSTSASTAVSGLGVSVQGADVKISQAGDAVARLSRQYVDGYAAAQRLNSELNSLSRAIEQGKTTTSAAQPILDGMVRKYGDLGTGAQFAAKGQVEFAQAISNTTARMQEQQRAAIELAARQQMIAGAREDQARENARQIAAANQGAFNRYYGSGYTGGSARDSASIFEGQFRQQEEMDRLRMAQQGQNFQSALNASFGIGGATNSARASAAVFEEATREADRFAAKAATLRAALDPVAAAQNRINAEIAEYAVLAQRGIITAEEFARAQAMAASGAFNPTAGAQRAAAFSAGQQIQDVAVTAALGMPIQSIAMMQGPQLATAIQQGGGVGALAEGLKSLVSPLNLVSIGFVAASAAAIQWGMNTLSSADKAEDVLKRHADLVRDLREGYSQLSSSPSFDTASMATFRSARSENELRLLLRNSMGTTVTGGQFGSSSFGLLPQMAQDPSMGIEWSVVGEFKPFSDAIQMLRRSVEAGMPAVSEFRQLVTDRWALEPNNESLAETAKYLLDATQEAQGFAVALRQAEAAAEALFRNVDPRTGRLRSGSDWSQAGMDELSQMNSATSLQMTRMREEAAAASLGLRARSPLEIATAARAAEEARHDDNEMPSVRRLRADIAERAALERAELQLRDAQEERTRSLNRTVEAQREEMSLIGRSAGEMARLRMEYDLTAQLREEAARNGVKADEAELELIRQKAAEYGRLVTLQERMNLQRDLVFEREQIFRTPGEQAIASRLRDTGLGMNSQEAQYLRENQRLAELRASYDTFASDFRSSLLRNGGDIGKAFGDAIMNALMSAADRALTKALDSLFNAFVGGPVSGSGGVTGGLLSGAVNKIIGATGLSAPTGANDNYAPGAVTRSPLPPVGGMDAYRQAISAIESGGRYDIMGPVTRSGDRAYGKYQVMGNNIGPWSEAALGKRLSPSEFLGSPAAQDAVFDHRFGSYVSRYGNPQDAASAWFTGRPLSQGANARDILGTTGSSYVDKFNAQLGKLGDTAEKTAESLAGGLGKVGDTLQNMSTSFFPAAPGGGGVTGFGGGGGLFGWLGSLSRAWSMSPAATTAIMSGKGGLFDQGGFTGLGGKLDPAGVVHRGEYVFDADATRNLGVGFLDSLHSAARSGRGFASGGWTGGAPRAPIWSPPPANMNQFDRGVDVHVVSRFEADGTFTTVVEKIVEKRATPIAQDAAASNVAAYDTTMQRGRANTMTDQYNRRKRTA